ncbi:MAG: IS66 family transposase [Leptolyngbyaceae bacterium]|nr:IS66 family transposase [Leptolyngbyaceae bacterium]
MDEIEIGGEKIPKQDWEATPASVKQALVNLAEQVKQLNERLTAVEEKLNQNSANSSRPPSSDGFAAKPTKAPQRRKAKGQQKRPRQVRQLVAVEQCNQVYEEKPDVCSTCGEQLRGEDVHPHRHQVWELPPIQPLVMEYRLHELQCSVCGAKTRAPLPAGVSVSGNGERLSAVVGLLSGVYRQSHAQVQGLMQEVFGIRLSYGGVNRLRGEMSEAIRPMVEQAKAYVCQQPLLHSDETSFPQGNRDGHNPQTRQGWLWVLVTPLVSWFAVVLSRSQETAKQLIGETFDGIVISDRYGAYGWIEVTRRQVCWAHLKRDLTAIAERSGVSQGIGESLLRRQQRLFRWWHRVRDGTLSRETFGQMVAHLRAGFKAELEAAARLPIGEREKTPLAKTVRTCQKLLQVEAALWTFVYTPDVEPTNNAAERALRPAVIWRRTSFGSQSASGSQFVSRMLTVSTSLRAQNRPVLEVLSQACRAARLGQQPPSLLPETEMLPQPPLVLLLPQVL